jgi:hypothetical protein
VAYEAVGAQHAAATHSDVAASSTRVRKLIILLLNETSMYFNLNATGKHQSEEDQADAARGIMR